MRFGESSIILVFCNILNKAINIFNWGGRPDVGCFSFVIAFRRARLPTITWAFKKSIY